MADISFVDSSIKKTLYKEISIQLGLNGFSFLILSETKKCLAFKHYTFQGIFLVDELIRHTSQLIEDDNNFQANFNKINLTYISQKSTLIPKHLFEPANAKRCFEFNQSLDELDELHYNNISEINAVNLFALPNYLANEFNSQLNGEINYFHQGTHLILKAFEIHRLNKQLKFFVNVNKGFFDLAIIDEGKLKLYNTYPYVHQTDFVYFLLYAAKELGYDASMLDFVFMGEHAGNTHLLDEADKYIGSLRFIDSFIESPVLNKKFSYREFFSLT